MSKDQMKFKEAQEYLNDEAEKIKKRLEELKKEDPLLQEDRDLDNESMTDAYEISGHDRLKAIEDELEQNLKKITRQLEKIQEGSYGKCDICKQDIDPERLRAVPYATVCIRHERQLETHLA